MSCWHLRQLSRERLGGQGDDARDGTAFGSEVALRIASKLRYGRDCNPLEGYAPVLLRGRQPRLPS